ncbi:MAG TPA: hypothetical protein VKZ96_08920 [Thermomicrobiales bacterium]|nr:hypothetical protein [Thermomicrobiales bacterium]
MNDSRVERYEDLQLLVQMLQLARQRADHLRQAEILTMRLAQIRSKCNPELRDALDRLTLVEEYRAPVPSTSTSRGGATFN